MEFQGSKKEEGKAEAIEEEEREEEVVVEGLKRVEVKEEML